CGCGRGRPFRPALPPGRPPHPCPPSRVGELRVNYGWGRSRWDSDSAANAPTRFDPDFPPPGLGGDGRRTPGRGGWVDEPPPPTPAFHSGGRAPHPPQRTVPLPVSTGPDPMLRATTDREKRVTESASVGNSRDSALNASSPTEGGGSGSLGPSSHARHTPSSSSPKLNETTCLLRRAATTRRAIMVDVSRFRGGFMIGAAPASVHARRLV